MLCSFSYIFCSIPLHHCSALLRRCPLHNTIIMPAHPLQFYISSAFPIIVPFRHLPPPHCAVEKKENVKLTHLAPSICHWSLLFHLVINLSFSCTLWVYRVPATPSWETEARPWKLSASVKKMTLFQNTTRTFHRAFLAGSTRQRLRLGSALSASRNA